MTQRKVGKDGRNKGTLGSFVAIERYLINSVAWRSLKPISRAAFVEVVFAFNGGNNGRIEMSAANLAARLGMGKSSAARALSELEAKGFLEVTQKHLFTQKAKLAAEYRLTDRPCNVTGQLPSKAFMRWTPRDLENGATGGTDSSAGGTVSQNATRESLFQSHGWDRERQKAPVHGATGGTLLYSSHTNSEFSEAQQGAANQKASAPARPRAINPYPSDAWVSVSNAAMGAVFFHGPKPSSAPSSLSAQKISPLRNIGKRPEPHDPEKFARRKVAALSSLNLNRQTRKGLFALRLKLEADRDHSLASHGLFQEKAILK